MCTLVEIMVLFYILFNRECMIEAGDLHGEVYFSVLWVEMSDKPGVEQVTGVGLALVTPSVEPCGRAQP